MAGEPQGIEMVGGIKWVSPGGITESTWYQGLPPTGVPRGDTEAVWGGIKLSVSTTGRVYGVGRPSRGAPLPDRKTTTDTLSVDPRQPRARTLRKEE